MEIVLKNGDRRYFNTRSNDREAIFNEIKPVIKCIQESTGDSVLWRISGEKTYHFGTEKVQKNLFTFVSNCIEKTKEYFGLTDYEEGIQK
ncbi:hypothetical protein DX928_23275 [Bacillus swezeyi]|uniref:Uncharacterized protein n=1 Tax=Bacillus swezeyi TaxID=1925020 RepID=A0A5M8RHR8_9BACI|nr:hypothetical protein DX927_23035 [Bacillus swezeyi]KAA6471498.1 hypothetical protein DX928_23275 [Bacillus swezeyi]